MNVFELFGTIAVNNRDANSALKDTAEKAEKTGSRIQAAFKNIGGAALKIGKVVGAGVTAMGTAIYAGVESTRDYRTEMAKLTTAFATNGFSAEVAKQTYKRLQAVLGETDQAVEAANHLAMMVDSEEDLAKWTDICTGVYATFGASLPIEGLTESANETSKVGQVTGSLADALNWAGISEDDFNLKLKACTSDAERHDLIMDTLYWTYKAAADQYKETGASVMAANAAQDNLTEAISNFWGVFEPIVTGIKQKIADLVTNSIPHVQNILVWIKENGGLVAGAIAAIAAAMAYAAAIAHPYAATLIAIAAALGLIITRNADGDPYNHFFDKYSDEELAKLQKWVDAVNEAKKAEEALANDMNNQELADAFIASQEKMEAAFNDANAIDGLIAAYNAWRSGQGENTGSDLYLDVPVRVSDDSESSVQTSIDGMTLEGIVKLLPDTTAIDTALSLSRSASVPVSGYSYSADGSHASGLDNVPRDGYLARLHKKEAVLNERDADIWRGGGSGRVEALLSELVSVMRAGQVIKLDSGIMAGQLTPAIDARLGTVARYKGRGN